MKTRILNILLVLFIFTGFTMSQDIELPKKGNSYITFGYTPFVTDLSSISTPQDANLVTVGYGKYLTNNLSVEGNLGFTTMKNYTSYAVGGNLYYNFTKNYYKVRPYMVAGAMFSSVKDSTDDSRNVLGANIGIGINYFVNENISIGGSYSVKFEDWLSVKPDPVIKFYTGIGKFDVKFYW